MRENDEATDVLNKSRGVFIDGFEGEARQMHRRAHKQANRMNRVNRMNCGYRDKLSKTIIYQKMGERRGSLTCKLTE